MINSRFVCLSILIVRWNDLIDSIVQVFRSSSKI